MQITRSHSAEHNAAYEVVERFATHGFIALYAGGFVRDMVRGVLTSADIDIATNATPDTVVKLFPHTVPVGIQFGVVIVVHRGFSFEVATFRSDIGIGDGRHPTSVVFTDAKHDSMRRDFTINGMFYDPLKNELIDHVSGHEDLERKIIRAIGDPHERFAEDHLRMLRAVRFAARFGFAIEDATWQAMIDHAETIVRVSPERIFAECNRMLLDADPSRAFTLLHTSGLLRHILPEVDDLDGVEQPPQFHPEGDALVHTFLALGLMEPCRSEALAWSVLLHDIGKKPTMRISDRIRFNGHDAVGADMALKVLRRLKAPVLLQEQVFASIANHMNFKNVREMRLGTLKKFLARPTISDEMELHRVDCMASHGGLENLLFVKEQQSIYSAEAIKPEPLLMGRDLLEMGFTPGKKIGEILSAVYDLQLEEKLLNREEAVAFVKGNFNGL